MNLLERYSYHLRRWWWLVVMATLIAGGAGFLIASVAPGPYRATSTILLNLTEKPGAIGLNDVLLSERSTTTYAQLITTRPILEEAASRLGGPETTERLDRDISASAVPETQLIRVSAKSDDADRAALIANTVAQIFIEENNRQSEGSRPGTVSIVESADPPKARAGPSRTVRTALGALAGASLLLIIIIARTYFDNTVWDAEDLSGPAPGVPVLGVLPSGDLRSKSWSQPAAPLPPLTEPYRNLAASAVSALAKAGAENEGFRSVAVVSAGRGEGRTSIVSRIGVSLALEGCRVTLVDFDLGKPSLHREFNMPNESGVSDLLSHASPPSEADDGAWRAAEGSAVMRKVRNYPLRAGAPEMHAQETGLEGLKVITSGHAPNTWPTQLAAKRLRSALERSHNDGADYILFDTPPLDDGAATAALAQLAERAILVVEARKTPAPVVTSIISRLDAMGLPALGIVLNKR